MTKEKQIDIIIDLLTEFDEMGFIPTTSVPNPEAFAIKWREKITKALEEYQKQSEGEWKPCFEDWRKQIEGDECSVCGFQHYGTSIRNYNFCPNCGAKMKGGAK